MSSWKDNLPSVRGKLLRDEPLAPYTWFRVGGAAEALFIPADAEDLADFLKALDPAVPVAVLGVGSNVIVRDGGVEGVVIRLAGRPWAQITTDGDTITAGAGALDSMVAKASAKAGIAGLEFYAGIPGTIGGALTMNAGCYGAETKDVLVSAWGLTRAGERVDYALADFGYTYRHSQAPADIIWVEATYRGTADAPEAVAARIAEITSRRETTQPIREKTGGSTFKNPEGHSAWRLIDDAGCRGLMIGGARKLALEVNATERIDREILDRVTKYLIVPNNGLYVVWRVERRGKQAQFGHSAGNAGNRHKIANFQRAQDNNESTGCKIGQQT